MFQYQPPRYNVDSDPFQSGFNALSQGLGDWNTAVAAQRKREQGLRVTNALAQKDYSGAMRATDNPELAMGIQRQVDGRNDRVQDLTHRDREFDLRKAETERQSRQWKAGFGLQKQEADRSAERFNIDKEKRAGEIYAGISQIIASEPDPQRAQAMWARTLASHPDMRGNLQKYGIDIGDYKGGAQFLIAQSRGYQPAEPGKINIVPEGGTAILTDPKTGKHQVIAQGGPKPLREHETKDAMWSERLSRSDAVIDKIAGVNADGNPVQGAYNPARPSNRFWPNDGIMGMANSTNWQQYQQAAREGIAAILRKDTGAAVTTPEWDLYFPMLYPQPGDGPAVVAQKRVARQQAATALRAASGPAYDRMFQPGMPQSQSPQSAADPSKMSDDDLLKGLGIK
jgi:hypothetical protein